jgi:hypothetical protein
MFFTQRAILSRLFGDNGFDINAGNFLSDLCAFQTIGSD